MLTKYFQKRADKKYELNPRLLDNIDAGAALLKKHLDNNSNILLVVDADTDGYCSSAMIYLYIKDFYPEVKLEYICHEHKQHGLEDIIEKVEEEIFKRSLLSVSFIVYLLPPASKRLGL